MTGKKLEYERKLVWERFNAREKKEAAAFADGYIRFVGSVKTERETVAWAENEALRHGFTRLESGGEKVYLVNKAGSIFLARRGRKAPAAGLRLIVSHGDTPRLDLKPQPLFEEENLAFLRTHYYGGIKKYQWVTIPLSLHGIVALKDGTSRELVIGEKETDPVFTVTDLLPHLARDQMEKKMNQGIDGEALTVLFASLPAVPAPVKGGKGREKPPAAKVKRAVLEHLNREYGLVEEDLVSAELKLVPAGRARELGLDRSMVLGYGQDDRICAYASLQAFFAADPLHPCVCLLVDREEIGSDGVDSIQSDFLLSCLADFFCGDDWNQPRSFARSRALSADVDAALDPAYREVVEAQNAPRLGCGVVMARYGGHGGKYGSSEATAEYAAWLRGIFDRDRVFWQTGELGKIDKGGGGTVAKYLTRHNLETIDIGPPLLSMHAPWEVSHKGDLYCVFRAYRAFYRY